MGCWYSMLQRCTNPKNNAYSNYGGRGITVCEKWKKEFGNFAIWALTNGYEENLTLERNNYNKSYNARNCSWITLKAQQSNRRDNVRIRIGNEVRTVSQWAELTSIPKNTINHRYKIGIRGVDLFKESLGDTGRRNISMENRKYRVRIEICGKKKNIGTFANLSSAIIARDKYLKLKREN